MALNVIAITSLSVAEQIREKLDKGELPREQSKAIARRVEIPYQPFKKLLRTYKAYDIIVDSLDEIDAMSGFSWQLVGIWDMETGKLLSAFDRDLYLKIMPDEVEYDEDGNEISRSRPKEPRDINLRAGQAPRQFPE